MGSMQVRFLTRPTILYIKVYFFAPLYLLPSETAWAVFNYMEVLISVLKKMYCPLNFIVSIAPYKEV